MIPRERLKYYLPEYMSKEHEKWIARITDQLFMAGWLEEFIQEWWQMPAKELNGFCPLEAVCNDKPMLAQMLCDKTLRQYEKKVNYYKDEYTAMWLKDRENIKDD